MLPSVVGIIHLIQQVHLHKAFLLVMQDLLTRHKPMVASYLSRNYDQVLQLHLAFACCASKQSSVAC